MKKSLLKLLATIVIIIGIIFLQGFIRSYFSIDPRIWFFVQYIGGIFLLVFSLAFLHEDIKMFPTYFENCKKHLYNLKEHLCKNNKIFKKIYNIIFNIVKFIFNTIWIIATAVLWFNIIYPDTYNTHNWMKIISFILYFIYVLSLIIEYKNSRRKFTYINIILYIIICLITIFDLLFNII